MITVALTLVASQARADVGLVIWIDDGEAFSKATYDFDIAELRALDANTQFRTLYMKPHAVDEALEIRLPALIRPGERVSKIILATHGDTDARTNRTILVDFGGFGEDGAFGPLKVLLDFLARTRTLSKDLHVYLNACSTFCDGPDRFQRRADALIAQLRRSGATAVSIWGAKQPQFDTKTAIMSKQRQAATQLVDRKSLIAMGLSGAPLAYLAHVFWTATSVDPLQAIYSLSLSPLSLLYLVRAYLIVAQILRAGTGGWLVSSGLGRSRVVAVDRLESPALATLGICENRLLRP